MQRPVERPGSPLKNSTGLGFGNVWHGEGTSTMYGELIPVGGGDPIPLLKTTLIIGRRESCDIVLRFPNVSSKHCQLTVVDGYWYVQDLNSSNGVKVNGNRVTEKRLDSGDQLTVAKHKYEVRYSPAALGAVGPPPPDDDPNKAVEIFSRSLLERAGLVNAPASPGRESQPADQRGRFDVRNNSAGQLGPTKDPQRPVS